MAYLIQGRDLVEKTSYAAMLEAFENMNERLKASTSFGRTVKPAVVNFSYLPCSEVQLQEAYPS